MNETGAACELSVVIPCLNEADTIGICVAKAVRTLRAHGIYGEVLVSDNGSSDGSIEIAQRAGARVVRTAERGYGHALMNGFDAARGRFVIMADADDSYDLEDLPKFVAGLRAGHELVQGCRLPVGGGRVLPGAMPFLHRWFGNPLLTFLARRMFRSPIHDVYCGYRGLTLELYRRLELRCTGMEFATEMIVKSTLLGVRMSEVPITLYPDGRKSHGSHLRTFRDGWRTLRFFLLYSPRWLYLLPGALLILAGLVGHALALPGIAIYGAKLDAHTLLFSSLFVLLGYQAVLFAVMTKVFAIRERLLPSDPRLKRFFAVFTLETGLVVGLVGGLAGVALLLMAVRKWWQSGFGRLDYAETMRWVIPGTTLSALGFQTILSSFFVSILGMHRK
ncbi:MAG: glycosyltransferase family 2 protein [Planctomycetes bacterium]|nr:glycosyltransferase family 2 protein [Planctomycetota bacterium]